MPYQHKREDICKYHSPHLYNSKVGDWERWRIEEEGLIVPEADRFQPLTDLEFWRLRTDMVCANRRPSGVLLGLHQLSEICKWPSRIHYRSAQINKLTQDKFTGKAAPDDIADELSEDEWWSLRFLCPPEALISEAEKMAMADKAAPLGNGPTWQAPQELREQIGALPTPEGYAQTLIKQAEKAEEERSRQDLLKQEIAQTEQKAAKASKIVTWTIGAAVITTLIAAGLYLSKGKKKRGQRGGKRS